MGWCEEGEGLVCLHGEGLRRRQGEEYCLPAWLLPQLLPGWLAQLLPGWLAGWLARRVAWRGTPAWVAGNPEPPWGGSPGWLGDP